MQEVELTLLLSKGDRVWGLTTDEIKALIERPSDVEIIRAFVERVEKRVNDGEEFYQNAVVDELISMEKETKMTEEERVNDK
jgi:hypothetical protein